MLQLRSSQLYNEIAENTSINVNKTKTEKQRLRYLNVLFNLSKFCFKKLPFGPNLVCILRYCCDLSHRALVYTVRADRRIDAKTPSANQQEAQEEPRKTTRPNKEKLVAYGDVLFSKKHRRL